MTYWTASANELEKALLCNTTVLMVHFLRTASPDDVARLVGEPLASDQKTIVAVIEALTNRLAPVNVA